MFDRVVARLVALGRRLKRVERREIAEFRRWVEDTNNLIHLSVLFVIPLAIALVTELSHLTRLSFLLFPPLASGAYALFAEPEGKYASPRKFVVGLTAGALCGWAAQEVAALIYGSTAPSVIHPTSAALSIFLAGAVTWALDAEEPAAFSTALLVLATDADRTVFVFDVALSPASAYVLGVAVSGSIVAAVFAVWRRHFYKRRAHFLYGTIHGDDHVLVPMRGPAAERTALFGARLAAAHEAGKVVLLDIVDDERIASAERAMLDGEPVHRSVEGAEEIEAAMAEKRSDGANVNEAEHITEPVVESVENGATRRAAAEAASDLEAYARRIREALDVPCEVIVASGDPAKTTIDTARAANCDLIVAPYEEDEGGLSTFVRTIFRGPIDAIAFRSRSDRERWERVLVAVARTGGSAHAMIDFACRLAGQTGSVSACTCIGREVERRSAESRLANVVEMAACGVETRVARSKIEDFIESNAGAYDLVVLGSSGERSAASRFISPPTFERLRDVETDVAIVDRADL
jgi:nucleotide-binding universal stress UspA family protein